MKRKSNKNPNGRKTKEPTVVRRTGNEWLDNQFPAFAHDYPLNNGFNYDTDPNWIRLAEAMSEIITNDATPTELYNLVTDYLSSNSGDIWGRLMVQKAMIVKILVAASCRQQLAAGGAQ